MLNLALLKPQRSSSPARSKFTSTKPAQMYFWLRECTRRQTCWSESACSSSANAGRSEQLRARSCKPRLHHILRIGPRPPNIDNVAQSRLSDPAKRGSRMGGSPVEPTQSARNADLLLRWTGEPPVPRGLL